MRQRLSSGAGLAVRKLRPTKGLTLAELSDRSGAPISSLSKLELGQVSLTYDKLMRLCRKGKRAKVLLVAQPGEPALD